MQINRLSRSHGFTLVELLVVIAIIAVLATIAATATIRFRAAADRSASIGALRQLQSANVSFATENGGSFVPPVANDVGWFETPAFISHLKGEAATFPSSGAPDFSVPLALMDAAVVRKKSADNTTLDICFGYTTPQNVAVLKQARLSNPSSSAAFITCDSPFIDHPTKSKIAYRHQNNALVVYYDGRAAVITRADIARIDSNGGATNPFWKADSDQ